MSSTLTVTNLTATNLTDGGGTTSTFANINQGHAKAWANFTGVTTTALRDSFNVSSLTDNGTGNTTVNLSSNMGNTNYTGSWFTNAATTTITANFGNNYCGGFGDRAVSSYGVFAYATSSPVDAELNDTIIFGDLA